MFRVNLFALLLVLAASVACTPKMVHKVITPDPEERCKVVLIDDMPRLHLGSELVIDNMPEVRIGPTSNAIDNMPRFVPTCTEKGIYRIYVK